MCLYKRCNLLRKSLNRDSDQVLLYSVWCSGCREEIVPSAEPL